MSGHGVGQGHVYFAERPGRIKIGWSGNVPSRMLTLNAALLGAVPGGRAVEEEMHLRFAKDHIEGEWFVDSPAIRAFADALPPAVFGDVVSPVFRMADRMVDGRLAQIIVGYHAAGHPAEHISRLLWAEHGIDVSGQTLRRWVPILVAETAVAS